MGQKNFRVDQRVELHAATNLSVRGLRFGKVVGSNARFVRVKLDLTGSVIRIPASNLKAVK